MEAIEKIIAIRKVRDNKTRDEIISDLYDDNIIDSNSFVKLSFAKTEINEDGSNIPSELMEVFSEFNQDEDSYKEMERLRLKAQEIGYDFDYGLSGEPTDFWSNK
jgi:hypothetical protein